jgi:hypothetical protein
MTGNNLHSPLTAKPPPRQRGAFAGADQAPNNHDGTVLYGFFIQFMVYPGGGLARGFCAANPFGTARSAMRSALAAIAVDSMAIDTRDRRKR